MGKFNLQPWDLGDASKFAKIASDVKKIIAEHGIDYGDKVIYGPTDVTVHAGGLAEVKVKSNGRVFDFKLQLYPEGMWEVL